MKLLHTFYLLFIFFMLAGFQLTGQSTVTFEATANSRQVLLNSYFEVTFTLQNANGTNFIPPAFKDFIILSGPNTSTSMQILNGVVSRSMGFSFTLQPKASGKYTIGSATIRANGKKMTSAPISIEVLKGNKNNQVKGSKADIFVRIEPSKPKAYVGEQILLDYKLYTTVSIDGYDIAEEPDFQGFFVQEMKRYNAAAAQEVINGKQYTTKILRRLALFPQQTGTLTIPPFRIQLAVVNEDERTGFFFNRNIKPLFFTTDAVNIEAKPLPPGAPDDFSGAVGSYEFQASVSRNMVTTDDAISVLMLANGTGDLKRVQALKLSLSDSFEVYPPKVLEEQMNEIQGEIMGKKTVEYQVLPKYPGNFTIRPLFTFFNTATSKYETMESAPVNIAVRQGSDKHSARNNSELNNTATDIRFIKTNTQLQPSNDNFFAGSYVFWGLAILPVLAFAGLIFVRHKQGERSTMDPALVKSHLANKEAQKRLAKARQHWQAGHSRLFYDEVSKAFLGYVCDKLNLPLSQLTKVNVRIKLQSLNISAPLIDEFMNIIQVCEMALFAGINNPDAMQSTFERAVAVIADIETYLKK